MHTTEYKVLRYRYGIRVQQKLYTEEYGLVAKMMFIDVHHHLSWIASLTALPNKLQNSHPNQHVSLCLPSQLTSRIFTLKSSCSSSTSSFRFLPLPVAGFGLLS